VPDVCGGLWTAAPGSSVSGLGRSSPEGGKVQRLPSIAFPLVRGWPGFRPVGHGANQLLLLLLLVAADAGHLAGQAVAFVLATPFSFVANKLWAFAESGRRPSRSE
jgi:hypothetical protein